MINRYSQGFKFFGPLEQNKDGDWVKYTDHLSQIKSEIDTAFGLLYDERELYVQCREQLQHTKKHLMEIRLIAVVSSVLVVVESAYFLCKALMS